MKIDSEPAIPATPEAQQIDSEPASELRSSRVTINVRTPSHTLEAIPSSAPSPSPTGATPPSPTSPTDALKTSVRDPEEAMPVNGAAVDVPVPSRSESGSPPIEIISVSADDDADFEDDESITMLDEAGRSLIYDPTVSFPFHDTAETFLETVIRLLQYLPTRKRTPASLVTAAGSTDMGVQDEQVPRAFIEWIDKYLGYAKTAPPRAIDDSYYVYREMWQSVPQLVLHIVNRK